MIHLKFSIPPSVNCAYAGYPRRHKSDKYKEWEITAEKELKTQEKYEIEGDDWLSAMYILWIDLHYKNGEKRKIDVCNYEKIVTDFLCKKIPWLEDHKIQTIVLLKKQKPESTNDEIEIIIDELST